MGNSKQFIKKSMGKVFLKKALEIFTYSIALLPIMPNIINSVCLIFWVSLSILYRIVFGIEDTRCYRRWFLFSIFSINYILLLISIIYSSDIKEGASALTKSLSMVIFPFVFFALPFPLKIDKAFFNRGLYLFMISTIIMCCWVLYNYQLTHQWSELSNADRFYTTFRELAKKATGKHPTYLSLYVCFSLGIAINNLSIYKRILFRVFNVCAIVLFIVLLLLFASRMPLISGFLGLIILLFKKIKKWSIKLVVLLLFTGFSFLLVRYTPAIYSRLQEISDTTLSIPKGMEFNSTNIRVGIFFCTWQLIKQNPILGHGIGSDKKHLNDCYAQFSTEAYKLRFYNTHNQYLNFWLLTGVFGILCFVVSLIYAFRLSLLFRDDLFLYFLVLLSISFLTENILSGQGGIVYYYYFLCFFIFFNINSEKSSFKKDKLRFADE